MSAGTHRASLFGSAYVFIPVHHAYTITLFFHRCQRKYFIFFSHFGIVLAIPYIVPVQNLSAAAFSFCSCWRCLCSNSFFAYFCEDMEATYVTIVGIESPRNMKGEVEI